MCIRVCYSPLPPSQSFPMQMVSNLMNWNLTFCSFTALEKKKKFFIDVRKKRPTIPCSWGNAAGCQRAKSTRKYGASPFKTARRAAHKRAVGEQRQPVFGGGSRRPGRRTSWFWVLWERRGAAGENHFYNERRKREFYEPGPVLAASPSSPPPPPPPPSPPLPSKS